MTGRPAILRPLVVWLLGLGMSKRQIAVYLRTSVTSVTDLAAAARRRGEL